MFWQHVGVQDWAISFWKCNADKLVNIKHKKVRFTRRERLTSARLKGFLQGRAHRAATVQQSVGGQDCQVCHSKHCLWREAVGWQGLPRLLPVHLGYIKKEETSELMRKMCCLYITVWTVLIKAYHCCNIISQLGERKSNRDNWFG